MSEPLRVGLASWIIKDGNYGDFVVGRQYAFALEFWPKTLVVRHPDAAAVPVSMTWLQGSTYAVKGKVSFVAHRWWVLDAGVPMYVDHAASPGPIGTPVRGEVDVGVDPFPYFERLAKGADAPALIFDWRVAAIEMDAAPLIETKPNFFERDRSRQGWKSLRHTNAWEDDGGHAAYVLTCSRLSGEPRHTL